jgi:hypothetical protein
MANSLSGFKLAADGIDLSPASSSANSYSRSTAKQSGGAQILRYPLGRPIDSTSDYLEIKIFKYEPAKPSFGIAEVQTNGNKVYKLQAPNFSQSFTNNPQKLKYFIQLPIPQSISDTTSITWGEDRINSLEATGIAFGADVINKGPVEAAKLLFESVKSGYQGLNETQVRALNNYLVAQSVGNFGGNVSPQGLVTRATGQVLQSNLELLFQGVNLRSFPFIFDFVPRNEPEARVVKQIINVFKRTMSPRNGGAGSGTNTNAGLFISSPDIYQLTYRSGSQKHPFLNTFKPCALSDISVNYTASNTYATYDDGTPVHIQMTLTFKEINPVYEEDYQDLEDSGDTSVGY